MSTCVSPVGPSRRRALEGSSTRGTIVLNLDESMDFGASRGIIHQRGLPGLDASAIPHSNQPVGLQASVLPTNAPIDVDAIEDEVELLSSSRAFPQGRSQHRRKRPVTVVLDEDLDVQVGPSGTSSGVSEFLVTVINNNRQKRLPRQSSVHGELHENYKKADCSRKLKKKCVVDNPEAQEVPAKDLAFTCAICLGKMTEETSTICGHIFCHSCIKTAIQVRKKCPTCRRTLTMRNIHRVYLPNAL
uniref:E3 ubiquitin-protein ligase AMFR n=1 Tax=Anthurium amnicola TaxID=1678845 RepID=A0A1D1YBB0_9ARAE